MTSENFKDESDPKRPRTRMLIDGKEVTSPLEALVKILNGHHQEILITRKKEEPNPISSPSELINQQLEEKDDK